MPIPTPPTVAHVQSDMLTNGVVNSYNGYQFPPAVNMKIQSEPVYDSSGRLPKYHKYNVTLEFVVTSATLPQGDATASSPVDYNMETLKRLLQVPGRPLVLSRRGFGFSTQETDGGATEEFVVNADNDLNFGPRPTLLLWESVGSSQVVRVQWSIEFCVVSCCHSNVDGDGICDNPSGLTYSINGLNLIDFSYSVSLGIDDEGFTIRSIIGTAMVPGHFVRDDVLMPGTSSSSSPNRSLILNTNLLQNFLQTLFPRLPKFHRDWQWDTARDGTRCDFRLTDKEIPSDNPYITGIIKMDCEHEVESSMPFFKWKASISGDFTIMPGYSRDQGWTAFLIVLNSRLSRVRLATSEIMKEYTENGGQRPKQAQTATFIPTRIRLRESIFSRKSSFQFDYTIFCPFEMIMRASGLFTPTPGDWTLWTATLPPQLFTGRGSRELGVAGLSNIVTICTSPTPASNNNTVGGVPELAIAEKFFTTTCPPKEKSWIDYKLWFETMSSAQFAVHQMAYKPDESQMKDSSNFMGGQMRSMEGYLPDHANDVQQDYERYNVFQKVGGNVHYLVMKGYAIRACYDIPIPELVKFGADGKLPYPIHTHSEPRILGSSGSVVFVGRSWIRVYAIPTPIGNIDPSVNLRTSGVPADYLSGEQIQNPFTVQQQ